MTRQKDCDGQPGGGRMRATDVIWLWVWSHLTGAWAWSHLIGSATRGARHRGCLLRRRVAVVVEEAEETFVEQEENLASNEKLVFALKAFERGDMWPEKRKFLCAGALVHRAEEEQSSSHFDFWLGDSDSAVHDVSVHVQLRGALRVVDTLLFTFLDRRLHHALGDRYAASLTTPRFPDLDACIQFNDGATRCLRGAHLKQLGIIADRGRDLSFASNRAAALRGFTINEVDPYTGESIMKFDTTVGIQRFHEVAICGAGSSEAALAAAILDRLSLLQRSSVFRPLGVTPVIVPSVPTESVPSSQRTVLQRENAWVHPRQMTSDDAARLRSLIGDLPWNSEPDSVDSLPSMYYSLFSRSREDEKDQEGGGVPQQILDILQPWLDGVLASAATQRMCNYGHPASSLNDDESTPVVSEIFVRRYSSNDSRAGIPPHFDSLAKLTAVLELNPREAHSGGFFLQRGPHASQRQYVRTDPGDVILHMFDALHGVDVFEGERLSLVVWFSDSEASYRDRQAPWLGSSRDPVREFMLAEFDEIHPDFDFPAETGRSQAALLESSAAHGFAAASFKLGCMIEESTGTWESSESVTSWNRNLLGEFSSFQHTRTRLGKSRRTVRRGKESGTLVGAFVAHVGADRDAALLAAAFWFHAATRGDPLAMQALADLELDYACLADEDMASTGRVALGLHASRGHPDHDGDLVKMLRLLADIGNGP